MNEIEKVELLVQAYRDANLQDGNELNELMRDLGGVLAYLETLRATVHDNFQREIFKLTKEGKTVSRAENEAHVTYPQMYQLRRIMDAGYKVHHALGLHLAYLKHERNAVNRGQTT